MWLPANLKVALLLNHPLYFLNALQHVYVIKCCRKAQEAATRKITEAEEYNSEEDDNNSNLTSTGAKETNIY